MLEAIVSELFELMKAKSLELLISLINLSWNFFLEYLPFFVLFAICYVGFIRPFTRRH